MSSKKHMDYDDLLLLYKFISLNYSERKITQLLKKDGINNCPVSCPNFKKWLCPNLKKFPYNCNFCEIRYSCRKKDFLIQRKHIFLE